MREQEAERQAAAEMFAKQAVPLLAKAGVRKIDIEYSGYGDSGGIDAHCYTGDEDKAIEKESLPEGADQMVCDFAESLIPAGFETNDGGQGRVFIDVVKGTWKLHHEVNITETESSDTEGTF